MRDTLKLLPNELTGMLHEAIRSAQADASLPAFDIPALDVRPSKRADQGDFSVAVMALSKLARGNPLDIAQKIAAHMPAAEFLAATEVAPPGYINFRVNPVWLKAQVNAIIAEGDQVFQLETGQGKRAQVEFVSANPTAPLHIGRSRGAIVGDAVARVLEATGYEVQREYYFNNAGVQMTNLGKSLRLRYLQALGDPIDENELTYQGEYLKDIATKLVSERGDALRDSDWKPFKEYAETEMFEIIKTTLKRVDILHNQFFNENSLYDSGAVWDVLKELEQKGYTYKASVPEDADAEERADAGDKGEAIWFRSTQFGDAKDRVLVKANGDPTYTLPDIAYHKDKIERGFDICVNILGADHYVQHQVVRHGVTALGLDASKIHVIIVQIVHLLRGGEKVKMSSRKGDFETLDDLIDQTSADAVRYGLLARTSDSHLNFDLDLAVKQTNENPVYYIQYAHVRCAGIFREAALRGVTDDGADLNLLGDAEMAFLRKALELGEVLELAASHLEPHRVAFYALELANTFHPIFDNVRVLHSEVPPEVAKARLRFYRAAQVILKRVLRLMGMTAPEVM